MKLSLNWLKEYVKLPEGITPERLAYDLTMSTVEVESIKALAEEYDQIIIGKILEIKRHPNADKLKIVIVNIGTKEIKVVCGGTNLKEGMLVIVALPGAKVRWHGAGEPVVLKETQIRGEDSCGMICSSNEIGLLDKFPCAATEITDLSALKKIKPGQTLAEVLGTDDYVIEIDNKSLTNRPDLWNHYGVARELSTIYKVPFKKIEVDDLKVKQQTVGELKIEIHDKKLCPRYIGCVVENIKIAPSPQWLIKRLEAVGQRAINNIVDITNYVMFDVGEPMHAFDLAKLNQKRETRDHRQGGAGKRQETNILVRKAKSGEKIVSLDGIERKLAEGMLVIADDKKPVAIAGIMGGTETEVDNKTKNIVLEAANFSALSARKTSQQLGLRTEGSVRWEKSLDPNLAELAMWRALQLIKEIIPGVKIGRIVDENYVTRQPIEIFITQVYLEKKIGQTIDKKEVLSNLKRLGFAVENKKGIYQIGVPSWRATGDIAIAEDIVEEVARLIGYDNLREKNEYVELKKAGYQIEFELENKIKNYLAVGCGMSEVFNYPWIEQRWLDKLAVTDKFIEIANPPAEENKYLQTSLVFNLFKNIEDNLRFFGEFKIFELARVFMSGQGKIDGADNLPMQPKMLAGVVVAGREQDVFLETKGIVENLFKDLRLRSYDLRIERNNKINFIDSEKCLIIIANNKEIGRLGEYKEKIKGKSVAMFEINFDKLVEIYAGLRLEQTHKFQPLAQYPAIERDLAFELDWGVKWGDVQAVILSSLQEPLIKDIFFLSEFDLGQQKSVAFRVVYQTDRTLTDEEVKVVEDKIIVLVEKEFGGKLRK